MDFKVVWTDRALADLESITAYIAHANVAAAERVGLEIIHHVEMLATFPLLGPTYPCGSSGRVREIVSAPYRIFYRVAEERRLVEILTLWHGARGEPQLPT